MNLFYESILSIQKGSKAIINLIIMYQQQEQTMRQEVSQSMEIDELPNQIKLSRIGILALEIIVKEFTNTLYHSHIVSSEVKNMLLNDISNYLLDKETYQLTYSSKKAIDIIRLEYKEIHQMLIAINTQLDMCDDKPVIVNKKRPIGTTDYSHIKKSRQ
jgi:hypothetical protein